MNDVLLFLDPKLTQEHIINHVPHVLSKLKPSLLQLDHRNSTVYTQPKKVCLDCKNQVDYKFVRCPDGAYVCTECGRVLGIDNLTMPYSEVEMQEGNPSLYSQGYGLRSYLKTSNLHLMKTNDMVERMQTSIQSISLTTSDVYKDVMRTKVYSQINELVERRYMTLDMAKNFKVMFHCYRTSVTRIHKINKVVACIIYISQHMDLLN